MNISNILSKLNWKTSYDYQPPPLDSPDIDKLNWLNSNLEKGKRFLRLQRAWKWIKICTEAVIGDLEVKTLSGMSKVKYNKLKRQIRETIANQANINPQWGVKTLNINFAHQVTSINQCLKFWWYSTFADRIFRRALQFAALQGNGYIGIEWDEEYVSLSGVGDIVLYDLSVMDFIPMYMNRDNDIQKCFAGTIRREFTIPTAHERFPLLKDKILPDRSLGSWISKQVEKAKRMWSSPALNAVEKANQKTQIDCVFPTVDILYTYIKDNTYNNTGQEIKMGYYYTEDGREIPNKYSYIVPYIGQKLVSENSRTAKLSDCKLYPRRRLMITASDNILYDGPAKNWHGLIPLAVINFDDWAMEFIAFPHAKEGLSLNSETENLLRAAMDSVNVRLQPPIGVDDSIPKHIASKINLRVPNQKHYYNVSRLKDGIKVLMDYQYYDLINPYISAFMKENEDRQDYVMGTKDFTTLMQLRQMPAGDSQQQLLRLLGVLPADHSRNLERSLLYIGRMWLAEMFCHYDTKRRIAILGSQGIFISDIDYDPESLIPKVDENDNRPRWQRALEHLANFNFFIAPYSLHEQMSISEQLKLLQLQTRIPIDSETIANRFNLENYGHLEGDTILDKYWFEQKKKAEMAAEIQKSVQGIVEGTGGGEGGGIGGNLGDLISYLQSEDMNTKGKEGRPNTNESPAQLKEKIDGNGVGRTTLDTSS